MLARIRPTREARGVARGEATSRAVSAAARGRPHRADPGLGFGKVAGRAGTHPVRDGETVFQDLVVPVTLIEHVSADAARSRHGF